MRMVSVAVLVCSIYVGVFGISPFALGDDPASRELPKLLCISWQHSRQRDLSKPVAGLYWAPNGNRIADAATLELIRNVQGTRPSRSGTELFLFFTHSNFRDTTVQVAILNAAGEAIDPKMPKRTSVFANQSGKSPGVVALKVYLPEEIALPKSGSVRLHYTVGEWTQMATFEADLRSPNSKHSVKDVRIIAVGEDTKQKAFVSLWVDASRRQTFQYRPRATLIDSMEVNSSGRLNFFTPVDVTTFYFQPSLKEIQSFAIYQRPVLAMEVEKVSFSPGQSTTPSSRAVDNITVEAH